MGFWAIIFGIYGGSGSEAPPPPPPPPPVSVVTHGAPVEFTGLAAPQPGGVDFTGYRVGF